MRFNTKNILIVIFTILLFIILSPTSNAGYQKMNNLNYDVKLNNNGSATIKETWNIYISSTNTLFKTFERDSKKYSNITNVAVYEEKGNELIPLNQQSIYEYYVTYGSYYALINSNNDFEIAWGVGLDNSTSTRTYILEYTVNDVVKKYNDCAEFYWMFLNDSNGIPSNYVSGTITLPKNVSNIDNLRVWAHGPLNGLIERTDTNTVSFSIESLAAEKMLETRIAILEPEMFSEINEIIPKDKLKSIITEETKWANIANLKRNSIKILFVFIAIIYVGSCILYFKKILKYKNEYTELKIKNNNKFPNFKYFRDIPRENDATPAEAAYLYYTNSRSYNLNFNSSNVLSATITDLHLKGLIDIEPNGKKDYTLKLNTDKDVLLKSDEEDIFNLLIKISNNSNIVTIKQIEKYAENNYSSFLSTVDDLKDTARFSHIKNGNLNLENEELIKKYSFKNNAYKIATVISIFVIFYIMLLNIKFLVFAFPLFIEFIICIFMLKKCISVLSPLTEQGIEECAEWKGLAKYLKEYSLIKDREVFEIALWEKFLVYATAFGIADKVLKQLKIAYPEINDPNYFANNSQYRTMYIISNTNFALNRCISSVYNAGLSAKNAAEATKYSSSGSGFGGGFSSGGGGGRWSEDLWEEDKKRNAKKLRSVLFLSFLSLFIQY